MVMILTVGWCWPGLQVKYVSEELGTGLFQYFIKVIPTDYKGDSGEPSIQECGWEFRGRVESGTRPTLPEAPRMACCTEERVLRH